MSRGPEKAREEGLRAFAELETMSDYHREHNDANSTDIAFTPDDEMALKHSNKRHAYLVHIGQGDLPYARATCRPDVEKHVQHQVQAYAAYAINVPKGRSVSSFPASAFGEDVDTSHVPDIVYFPLQERGGMYHLDGHAATSFGRYGPHKLGLSGGKKRSRKHKRSHRKKSHRKKSGKKSHRKSRRH